MANYTKWIYETLYGQSLLQERWYDWESTPFDRSNKMYSAFDYLLYSKTQNIINEFIQIRAFINELERDKFYNNRDHRVDTIE